MQKIIGGITIILGVFGGYIWAGGTLLAIWQPAEYLIIGCACFGALIIGNPPHVLREMKRQVKDVFSNRNHEQAACIELMCLMQMLLETMRKGGLKALDSHIEEPATSTIFQRFPHVIANPMLVNFITDNLRLIALGQMTPHELEAMLEQEIITVEQELLQPSRSMQRTAEALPGFGILAAVMGIIITMQSIDGSIALIGFKVAAALVGTFIGIFACYCVFDPMSNAMSQQAKRYVSNFEFVRAALTTFIANKPILIAIDAGRKYIQQDIKPTFSEMERHLQEQT